MLSRVPEIEFVATDLSDEAAVRGAIGKIGAAGNPVDALFNNAGVADTLEHTGSYLQREGLSGASDHLMDLVRARPLESLLVCVGVGFLLAQTSGARR